MLKRLIFKKMIKTMNNKLAIHTYLSTVEIKNKLCIQEEQRQTHGYGVCFVGCQMRGGHVEWVRNCRN